MKETKSVQLKLESHVEKSCVGRYWSQEGHQKWLLGLKRRMKVFSQMSRCYKKNVSRRNLTTENISRNLETENLSRNWVAWVSWVSLPSFVWVRDDESSASALSLLRKVMHLFMVMTTRMTLLCWCVISFRKRLQERLQIVVSEKLRREDSSLFTQDCLYKTGVTVILRVPFIQSLSHFVLFLNLHSCLPVLMRFSRPDIIVHIFHEDLSLPYVVIILAHVSLEVLSCLFLVHQKIASSFSCSSFTHLSFCWTSSVRCSCHCPSYYYERVCLIVFFCSTSQSDALLFSRSNKLNEKESFPLSTKGDKEWRESHRNKDEMKRTESMQCRTSSAGVTEVSRRCPLRSEQADRIKKKTKTKSIQV